MHEADQPNVVFDLPDAHQLAGEHGTEVDFMSAKADAAAAGYAHGSIVIRVLELWRWLVSAG